MNQMAHDELNRTININRFKFDQESKEWNEKANEKCLELSFSLNSRTTICKVSLDEFGLLTSADRPSRNCSNLIWWVA